MNLAKPWLLLGVVALLSLGSGDVGAQEKIKMIYTPSVGFATGYVAQDQGFFKKRGLDVEFVQTAISSNIPSVIVSGSVDIGGPTPVSVLEANENGLDLVVIAGGAVYPLPGDGTVARTGSGIEKTIDLKGRSVGVPGIGTVLHVLLRRGLRQRGVDPDSVRYLEIGFPQAREMLQSGQVDAYTAVEPFTDRITQSGVGKLLPDWPGAPDGTLTVIFATTRQWATQHRAAVSALRDGMKEANAFIKTHPDDMRRSVAAYAKLPPEVVKSIPIPAFTVDVSPQQVQFWIDLLKEENLIKGDPEPQTVLFE
jgi:NitT/TauT family transport system substrate-binding protein